VQLCERIVTTKTRNGSLDSLLTKIEAKSLARIGSFDWRIFSILIALLFSAADKIAKSLNGDCVCDEYRSCSVDE